MSTQTLSPHANIATENVAEVRAQRLSDASQQWGNNIQQDPANAQLTFAINAKSVGSVATEIRAGKHAFVIDEPAGLAGDDAGAAPVEYALGAIAACQQVVYRLYAHQLGIQVDDVQIQAEGDLDVHGLFGLDASVRPGFTDVRLKVSITGPESAERYRELQEKVDAHCPILDLCQNPTPVNIDLEVNA